MMISATNQFLMTPAVLLHLVEKCLLFQHNMCVMSEIPMEVVHGLRDVIGMDQEGLGDAYQVLAAPECQHCLLPVVNMDSCFDAAWLTHFNFNQS
jgi:hypothetical protein